MASVVVMGCGTAQVSGTGSASVPHTASKSATSSPASSSAVEPAPASVQPSAQDRTNYEACMGGDCEVAVSKPVTITLSDSPIDAGPFTVQNVSADSVEVRMGLPAGPGLGTSIKTGCTAAFYSNNASGLVDTSCPGEPGDIPGMYVKQTVTVVSITNGTAVVDLKSG